MKRLYAWLLVLVACGTAAAPATLPRAPGTDLRVLAWNVSRENFYEHADAFAKVLTAIDADVLILDEMSGDRAAHHVMRVLRRLGRERPRWRVSYGSSGYNQRAVIAYRGGIRALSQFESLPYPATFVESMRGQALAPRWRSELDQSLAGGIGAHGAVLDIGGKRLLVIGVDLQCCGDTDDAWEERRRIVESTQIRRRLNQATARNRVDAVIVGGDFNTTRGPGPVRALQGKEKAKLRLEVVASRHANGETWTWDGRDTPYESKQIDYLLHDRGLKVLSSVIFDPESMPANEVDALGLTREFLRPLSAHRPVVADFAWR